LPAALAERFGLLPDMNQWPEDDECRYVAVSGYVQRNGLFLSLPALALPRIDQDLPAIADWLYSKGCVNVTYECLRNTGLDSHPEDLD
jgi:hypothetical protein